LALLVVTPEGDLLLPIASNQPQKRRPRREATESIAFAFAAIFFLRFQPKNRMSSPQTT
jgi:hypothetical protein